MAAKEISVKRYVVRLSADEREQLQALMPREKSSAKRLLKARILLKADVSEAGEGLYEEGQVETDMSGQHFFTSLDVCGIHGLSPICMTRLVAEPYPTYIRSAVREGGTNIPLAADKGSGGRNHSGSAAFEAIPSLGSSTWIRQD